SRDEERVTENTVRQKNQGSLGEQTPCQWEIKRTRSKSMLSEDNQTLSTHSHSPCDNPPNEVSTATFTACFLPDVSGDTGDSWCHHSEITFVSLAPHAAEVELHLYILSLPTCILPTTKVTGVDELARVQLMHGHKGGRGLTPLSYISSSDPALSHLLI
ncbi:hypothetical protein HispidOSU_002837, partial [Sigmodon hispidus]